MTLPERLYLPERAKRVRDHETGKANFRTSQDNKHFYKSLGRPCLTMTGPSFTVFSSAYGSLPACTTHLNTDERKRAGLENLAGKGAKKVEVMESEKVIAIISVHGPPARVASNKRCQVACLIKSACA